MVLAVFIESAAVYFFFDYFSEVEIEEGLLIYGLGLKSFPYLRFNLL